MSHSTYSKESGFALLPTVVILMVLTVLAVASLRSATVLEKMTGNERDAMVAQQAAEAALRDAERDLDGVMANGILANPNCGNPAACRSVRALPNDLNPSPADFYTETAPNSCNYGICFAPVSEVVGYFAAPVWTDPAMSGPLRSAQYGQFTGAANLPGVAQQPVYWIEVLGTNSEGSATAPNQVIYRITARGVGRSAGTTVFLQSIYDPSGN
jgi:type IV pilus assembly protein PilX